MRVQTAVHVGEGEGLTRVRVLHAHVRRGARRLR